MMKAALKLILIFKYYITRISLRISRRSLNGTISCLKFTQNWEIYFDNKVTTVLGQGILHGGRKSGGGNHEYPLYWTSSFQILFNFLFHCFI